MAKLLHPLSFAPSLLTTPAATEQRAPSSKVKILKPHDPEGKQGPKMPMPDYVVVHEPKDDSVTS